MTTIEQPTATATATATDPYLAAVADALGSIPEAERQELLDDLAQHLAEVAGEDGEVIERLGPPEAYAAELLASAGISVPSSPQTAERPSLTARLRAATDDVRGSRAGQAVLDFLPELRPGWWVLRAWAALAVLTLLTGGEVFPIPDPIGNDLVAVALLAGTAVASVHLGRSGARLGQALTVIGVVGVALALTQGGPRTEYVGDCCGSDPYGTGALTGPEGQYIANIWPYDGAGNPIDGVFLFDQDGNPITVGQQPTAGPVVQGLFPQPQVQYEYDAVTGLEREVPRTAPAVVVPQLPVTTTSTTAPATTASTSPETTATAPG